MRRRLSAVRMREGAVSCREAPQVLGEVSGEVELFLLACCAQDAKCQIQLLVKGSPGVMRC